MWLETREKMVKMNQGGQADIAFGRWKEGHVDCAWALPRWRVCPVAT